jgi:hypothetical protein
VIEEKLGMNHKTEILTAIIEAANEIAQQAESMERREVPIGLLCEVFDRLMDAEVALESCQREE